jgi:hypothetical protein
MTLSLLERRPEAYPDDRVGVSPLGAEEEDCE